MSSPVPDAAPASRRRALVAVAIGNGIEWFDFAIYAYLAAEISRVFFPGSDPSTGLLATFAVFAAAFFFRPVGGLLFGHLGDRLGRRRILATVLLLMAGATFLVGVLPGYETIGVAAPILLVVLRCLQGLSAGGEFGGAATFLAEYSAPSQRGRYLSTIPANSFLGLLAASLFILLLRSVIPPDAFAAWGWRIPFLVALPLGLTGLYIRLKLEETPEFVRLQREGGTSEAPIKESVTKDLRGVLISAGLVVLIGVASYMITTYLTVYLTSEVGFDSGIALWLNAAVLVSMVVVLTLSGIWSDRIGRRPLMLAGGVALIILPYPMFLLLSSGSIVAAAIGGVVLGSAFSVFQGAAVPAMTELFTTSRRYSGFSIGYNISIALFGGTAPYLSTYLIGTTGSNLAPSWMLVVAAVISLAVVLVIAETAPAKTHRHDAHADVAA